RRRHDPSTGERAIIPGFVDSHTHLAFGDERIDDFGRRARGEGYQQIAAAGGGIMSSARSIEDHNVDSLVSLAVARAQRMLDRGTTTLEVKTGYGMSTELELRLVEVIEALIPALPQDVRGTLLAHVLPPDARHPDRRAGYLDAFMNEVMEPVARRGFIDFFDCFVDAGAFTLNEARSLGISAKELGWRLKYHVDQFGDDGGAALCSELGALSADHLEHVGEEGRSLLGQAGVVATVLPGCSAFLGPPFANARALRDAGCEVAIATDFNPGSAHVVDLALCGTLAATQCGLSLDEALWGVTRGGAKALSLQDRGRLVPSERADFVVLGHRDWRSLFYHFGEAPIDAVLVEGELVSGAL
ncbi:MAG: imidazolonepropionase, partial [Myxococcota bacterium]